MKFKDSFWGVVQETEDMFSLKNEAGYILDKVEIIRIARGLIKYAHQVNQADIRIHNYNNQEKIYDYYGRENFKNTLNKFEKENC